MLTGVLGLLVGLAVIGLSAYLGLSLPWLLLAGALAALVSAAWLGGGSGWSSSTGAYRGIGRAPGSAEDVSGRSVSGRW